MRGRGSCRRQIPNLNIQRPVLAAVGAGEYSRPDFRDVDLLAPASMAAVDADMAVHQFGVTIAQCFIAVHGPQLQVLQGKLPYALKEPACGQQDSQFNII
jgi:hypothetical protein